MSERYSELSCQLHVLQGDAQGAPTFVGLIVDQDEVKVAGYTSEIVRSNDFLLEIPDADPGTLNRDGRRLLPGSKLADNPRRVRRRFCRKDLRCLLEDRHSAGQRSDS